MSIDRIAIAPATPLLGPHDPEPVGFVDRTGPSPFVVICDHAGNAVPASLAGLGLPPEELARHIAIDVGVLPVAERLAAAIAAPLIFQRYSRLVIDCNRRPGARDSIAEVADGTVVPGNRDLGPEQRQARLAALHEPYHRRINAVLDARAAAGTPTFLVSVHSFTPALRLRPTHRPWDVGLCWFRDDRFSRLLVEALAEEPGLTIGQNQPYCVDMENDFSIPIHGETRGLPYVEFEIRQDLLGSAVEAEVWAERLARVLRQAATRFEARADAGG